MPYYNHPATVPLKLATMRVPYTHYTHHDWISYDGLMSKMATDDTFLKSLNYIHSNFWNWFLQNCEDPNRTTLQNHKGKTYYMSTCAASDFIIANYVNLHEAAASNDRSTYSKCKPVYSQYNNVLDPLDLYDFTHDKVCYKTSVDMLLITNNIQADTQEYNDFIQQTQEHSPTPCSFRRIITFQSLEGETDKKIIDTAKEPGNPLLRTKFVQYTFLPVNQNNYHSRHNRSGSATDFGNLLETNGDIDTVIRNQSGWLSFLCLCND